MFNRDNIAIGQMPTQVIVGFVEAEAANGNYTKNPFAFKHFNLNYLCLNIGSEQIPGTALTPDYDDGFYIREYQTLFDALGLWRSDRGIDISRDAYPKGYALYAFNLTPNQKTCDNTFNLLRQGNLRMEVKFSKPLEKAVTAILHLTYENMLEIDQARNVVYDFSS